MNTLPQILTILLIIILLIAGVSVLYLLISVKKIIDKFHLESVSLPFEPSSIKDDAVYNVQIDRLISKLKYDVNADKIFLCRFHNGGRFSNGFTMKKFTMTNETHGGTANPLRDQWRDVINSHYAEVLMQTLILGMYVASAPDECMDLNFRNDMMLRYKFNSVYLFALKQFDGKEEGFFGLCFKESKILSESQKDTVELALPNLIGLINMKKEL